jgi:PmbA protein
MDKNYTGLAESTVKKALKMGADDCIATVSAGLSRQLKFANNEIATSKCWDITNMEIFMAKDKKVISTSVEDLKQSNMEKILKKLISTMKGMKPKDDYYGIAKGPFKYKSIPDTFDKKIISLSDKGIDIISSAISKARGIGAKRCAGVMLWNSSESFKATSEGIGVSGKDTDIQFSMRALVDKERSGHTVCVSRTLDKFNPNQVAEEAAGIATKANKPTEGKVGKFDIVFHPMAFANLMSYTADSFSAFYVDSGFSFLTDMIGKKVASDMVSIKDNGIMPNGYYSTKYDEEGYPVGSTDLLKDGVMKTYLHNTSTAKKHNAKNTGNAGMISPSAWNIDVNPGDMEVDDMISGIKDGLFVTNLWYTRFTNYRTGDFSTIPRDSIFYIKNGKIVGNWKSIRISDNMLKILENVSGMSKNRDQIFWWETSCPVKTPYVLVKDVNITRPQ